MMLSSNTILRVGARALVAPLPQHKALGLVLPPENGPLGGGGIKLPSVLSCQYSRPQVASPPNQSRVFVGFDQLGFIMGYAHSIKAGWDMADEAKTSLNWQSLAQFVTVSVILITCAVTIDRRLTTIEVQRQMEERMPLSDKQRQAIREYVTEFLQNRNQGNTEESTEDDQRQAQPKRKPQSNRKPKISGQAQPFRANQLTPSGPERPN